MQQAKPLLIHFGGGYHRTCHIPAGAVEVLHQAGSDWITCHKHDRDRRGCVLRCESRGIAAGRHEHIDAPLHKLCSECRQTVILAASPAVFDGDVVALEKAGFSQTFEKRLQEKPGIVGGACAHEPDHRPRCLLCAH